MSIRSNTFGYEDTEDNVRDRFIMLSQARTEPVLSENEIDYLIQSSKRQDKNAKNIAEAGWTPTWVIEPAIAEAYKMKAAKVATSFDVGSGRQLMKRKQMYDMLIAMSHEWLRKCSSEVVLPNTNKRRSANFPSVSDELFLENGTYGPTSGNFPGGYWIDE